MKGRHTAWWVLTLALTGCSDGSLWKETATDPAARETGSDNDGTDPGRPDDSGDTTGEGDTGKGHGTPGPNPWDTGWGSPPHDTAGSDTDGRDPYDTADTDEPCVGDACDTGEDCLGAAAGTEGCDTGEPCVGDACDTGEDCLGAATGTEGCDTGDTGEPCVGDACDTGESGDPNCTYSQGYWKNHPEAWPLATLEIGPDLYTAEELLAILKLPVAGDKSLILARQLIAARLNVAQGADDTAIATTLTEAEAWCDANHDGDGLGYGSTDSTASDLGGVLEAYNTGETGPGHCPDDDAEE